MQALADKQPIVRIQNLEKDRVDFVLEDVDMGFVCKIQDVDDFLILIKTGQLCKTRGYGGYTDHR